MWRLGYFLGALVMLDIGVYVLAHLGHVGSERHAQHALAAATGIEMLFIALVLLIGALGGGFGDDYKGQGW